MFDLAIRGGSVISPQGIEICDVAISGEKIAAIGGELPARASIDASGCYVIPGGVDQHVHLQLPLAGRVSSDSFASGTIAAALGGTTSIVDFVTPQPGQSFMDGLAERRGEADGDVAIDYGLHMTIPTWHAADRASMAEIPAAIEAGCPTFKMYQAYAGMMLEDAALYRAMAAVANAGGSVVLHSECGPLIEALRDDALAAGRTGAIEHERTRPAALEATAVARAAEISRLTQCPLLIFHVGCAASVNAIEAARAQGVPIWGETCPQYLLLTAAEHLAMPEGMRYICAPPLRSHADQRALWRALREGTLQVISTDHCPWTLAEKAQRDFTQAPGGVPSIEARLALVHHFGVGAGEISLARWVELCCTNPARRMGMTTKGELTVGFDADIVIFDPNRDVTISQQIGTKTLHEAADWTPYEGISVQGWPRTVLLRGRAIVGDGMYIGRADDGRFIHRQPLATFAETIQAENA